jgi:hypothetical protein
MSHPAGTSPRSGQRSPRIHSMCFRIATRPPRSSTGLTAKNPYASQHPSAALCVDNRESLSEVGIASGKVLNAEVASLIRNRLRFRMQRYHALGTVDRFGLAFQNQGVEKLKLLKVVDLTSYRVSTSAPAITAEGSPQATSKIFEKSAKVSHRLNAKWLSTITILTTLA